MGDYLNGRDDQALEQLIKRSEAATNPARATKFGSCKAHPRRA
jgi:hypothetical protein